MSHLETPGGVNRQGKLATPPGHHLEIHVVGVPAPQGSKKGFIAGGRAVVVDTNQPRLRTWREDVKHAALGAIELHTLPDPWQPLTGPVELDVTFLMPRPKHHFRTGKHAHLLRDNAPAAPAGKPDVDKLLRSSLDALTAAGLYRDDAQVVTLTGRKVYTLGHPGAVINVYLPQSPGAAA